MTDELLVETAAGVMVITLNRPQRRNAIDLPTAEALSDALDRFDDAPDLRVGVLTGNGGTFCAGMDLKAFATTGQRPITERRGGLGMVGRPPVKPIIAAAEGFVLGGGLELALACDLIVAADDAVLGFPEVLRGQVAAAGGALRLRERVPYHLALEMLLTGEPMSAPRAAQLGLVNRLAPAGQVLSVARDLAALVARGAPLALAATKRIAVEARDWPIDEQFGRQWDILEPVRGSEDAQEGARAFAEKRAPRWTGR
ncbi:MAG: enoyl-CoA hydratase [Frankiaceae bacterium]|nr:enoyl-CoA hydratase [Frankiaceae bacterium]